MQHFYFLLGLGALAAVAFLFSLLRRFRHRNRLPYRVDAFLLSPSQRAFGAVLERAVGQEYRVYAKVRAADIIEVERRLDRRARERAAERLAEQVFDFVVCTRESSAIACAVNLAARSRLSRRPPKNRLDRICAAAKLPFVRFREGDVYSVVEIEEQVFSAMQTIRIHPRAEEPSAQDTRAALRDLSDVIGDKVPERSRTKRSAPPTPPTHSTERATASTPIPIKPATRTEPRLHLDDDLDIGPEVRMPEPRIEVEFDEDRPKRARI
ncbi:DUF2726 domain-containing protein [Thiocapsa roseopersicina]|uniref:DUF2726 domain-containing protein n=1 Tax=Thiocapsa roseopersicina TaxID=1058 RepID=A0A1H2RXP6_THIRO|nr:DUF2726 domain-containing protein [Thiocapsa roseopersicina]SDW24251.1 Protein of unknown function [Thiocapsa roseopersicina]